MIMKKYMIMLIGMFFCLGLFAQKKVDKDKTSPKSIHKFTVKDINGNDFRFAELKGRKVMIVNTASKCGLTPQFEALQAVYEKYKDQNFVIVGFPSNDFLNQDPGTNEEILTFCSVNYGVTFPMMSKVVVTGKKKHPIYKFLTDKKLNGVSSSTVQWNFQKYLIDENGYLVDVISPRVKPDDPKIINWIEGK